MSDQRRKKFGDYAGRASEVRITNREVQWRSYERRSPGQADRDYHGGEPRDQREPESHDDME